MRDHTPNTRVTARRMNRVIGGLTSMRSRLEGVSNVVAALRAGIGTVGMSSECSALLALSAPLADALTSETGAVADSAALRAAASQGSRLPAASKSSRGLLIDTNIGHTPHFPWLPLHKRHGAYRFDATYCSLREGSHGWNYRTTFAYSSALSSSGSSSSSSTFSSQPSPYGSPLTTDGSSATSRFTYLTVPATG